MEIAFVSANKLRIELDKKQGIFASRIVSIFINNKALYISTMLVGNNVALVVYGILMASLLDPVIQGYTSSGMIILLIQTIISTLVILVTAEFLPKTLFRINPNKILNFFSVPVLFIYYFLYPISKLTIWISSFLLKLVLKVNIDDEKEELSFGKVDLDNIIDASQPEIKQRMILNMILSFFRMHWTFQK